MGMGGRNRAKIQHLRLLLEPTDLTTYLNMEKFPFREQDMYGGCEFLYWALYLLCEGLSLATIELVLNSQYFSEIFDDLFSPNHPLIPVLQQFRGIKGLRVSKSGSTSIPSEVSKPENSTYVQTKALMESGHTDDQLVLKVRAAAVNNRILDEAAQASSPKYQLVNSTRYGFKNEPANQLQRAGRQAT